MSTRLALPLIASLVAAAAVGCSSSGSSTPALCSSLSDLKTSVNNIKNFEASQNGIGAMQTQLKEVRGNLNKVVDDAQKQFAPEADQIKSDMAAVQNAANAAKTSHSAQDISTTTHAVHTLATDVQQLATSAKSVC